MLLESRGLQRSRLPELSLLQLIPLRVAHRALEEHLDSQGQFVLVGQHIPVLIPALGWRSFREEVLSLQFQQPH